MATIHPSRLGLVPQERSRAPPTREEELKRNLTERKAGDGRRNPEDSRSDDRSRYRKDEQASRRSPSPRRYRDPSPRRDRVARSPRPDGGEHDRPPHLHPSGDKDGRHRRASPTYRPYDGPPRDGPMNGGNGGPPHAVSNNYGYGGRRGDLPQGPPHGNTGGAPPWRGGGNDRGGWQGGPGRGAFGAVDLEKRRSERDVNPLTIWPPSPKAPYRDEDEMAADRKAAKALRSKKSKSRKSKKRSKKYSDSDDSDASTDSEEEERRRRRKRREKEKERERRRKHSDGEEGEDEKLRKRRKSHSRARSVEGSDRNGDGDEELWVEKAGGSVKVVDTVVPVAKPETLVQRVQEEEDLEVGPNLPTEMFRDGKIDRAAFANMLPGEGEAMAAYLASGQRIPRRGEIGLDSETIEKFEDSGYVMSGSRHQRMNAVRLRKENQVINAEEQRAILKLQREEKEKKEGMIIAQFRDMMEDNLKRQGIDK